MSERDFVFDVETPLNFRVHVTRSYWETIVNVKHPVMEGREEDDVLIGFSRIQKAETRYRKQTNRVT